jgi:RimJ/RimL family protein N-acetyltransferase
MADEIDRANDEAERFLARALQQNAASRAVLTACGQCHFCLEPVADGLRFCDADCRDEFDRRSAARLRNGLG